MSNGQATLAIDRSTGFRVVNRRIPLHSDEPTQFVDITDQIAAAVRDSGISNGVVVVYAQHTTAGITINEAEPLLLGDMCRLLDRFASREDEYQHDDLSIRTVNLEPNERKNGHAHCQRLFIGASESVPVVDGDVQLGKWQRIFFVELDGPRPRSVTVQLMGI
jgi:secondary thiamine-phosphate synthase enzyme